MRSVPAIIALLLAFQGTADAQEPANPIRIVVFDIAGGVDAEGVGTLANVGKVIRDAKADIVFLQTVDSATTRARGVHQAHVLSSITGLRGAFAAMRRSGGGAQGVAILTRWTIHRDTAETAPQAAGMLDVSIESPAGELRVVNLQADTTRSAADFGTAVHTAAQQNARVVAFSVTGADAPAPVSEWQDAWTLCGPKTAEQPPPDSAHAGHGAAAPAAKHVGLHLAPGLRCTEASRLAADAGSALLFVVTR